MRTSEHSTPSWQRVFAALGALLGLALAPAPAQAQVCGDFDEIANGIVEYYYDWLGDFFPLDGNTCDSIASTFYKACNAAVKDTGKCVDRQFDALAKAAKPACKAEAVDPSSCAEDYKAGAESQKQVASQDAQFAYEDCFDEASDLFDDCFYGL